MYSMWKTTPRFSAENARGTCPHSYTPRLSVHLCTHSTSLDTRLKKCSVLCSDLMGSHRLSSQTLAKKRWDPTHPQTTGKILSTTELAAKYSFCRKQNVSSPGIFFFFLVLSLLLSRKGKCLSKRPSKHLRKPKPGSSAGRVEHRVNELHAGQAPGL